MSTKNPRRRAREYALQGTYQFLMSGGEPADIARQIGADVHFAKADGDYFRRLLRGVLDDRAALETAITPHLDRPVDDLTPIERAILLIGAYELRDVPEVPYRVAVNEGIELAKTFGGTDAFRYVNGVLDKLARDLRPAEAQARS